MKLSIKRTKKNVSILSSDSTPNLGVPPSPFLFTCTLFTLTHSIAIDRSGRLRCSRVTVTFLIPEYPPLGTRQCIVKDWKISHPQSRNGESLCDSE